MDRPVADGQFEFVADPDPPPLGARSGRDGREPVPGGDDDSLAGRGEPLDRGVVGPSPAVAARVRPESRFLVVSGGHDSFTGSHGGDGGLRRPVPAPADGPSDASRAQRTPVCVATTNAPSRAAGETTGWPVAVTRVRIPVGRAVGQGSSVPPVFPASWR